MFRGLGQAKGEAEARSLAFLFHFIRPCQYVDSRFAGGSQNYLIS